MHRSTSRRVRCPLALGITLLLVACSSEGGSTSADSRAAQTTGASATTAPNPVSGGPCTVADALTTIGGVDHICTLLTGKTLIWKPADERTPTTGAGDGFGLDSSAEIPSVIENWGFDLRPYDPATGMAGVMKIEGVTTPAFDPTNPMDSRYLFLDYGEPDSGHTDVQMTFFLPLGTPVLAMVTGVVCDVPTLYSGDFSVRVAPTGVDCVRTGRAEVSFETEHVIDPLVKVGDSVVAGQQVATVGDYRKDWTALGLGVVEIGAGFNRAGDDSGWHACPARFLDPAHADELLVALASIHTAWEAESGNPDLYDEASQSPLGCTTIDDFNG